MDPRFEAMHPREPAGKFRAVARAEPEVSLSPAQAAPDPGTLAALQGLADDLLTADGAEPIGAGQARVRSVAFFASELSRQCINAATKQALTQGRPGETVTVALSAAAPLPRAILGLEDDAAGALERIRLARTVLAQGAAKLNGGSTSGLVGVDSRLAAMEAFLIPAVEDRAA